MLADALRAAVRGALGLMEIVAGLTDLRRHLSDPPRKRQRHIIGVPIPGIRIDHE